MKVYPLQAFDGVAFGSPSTVLDTRGKPAPPKVNARGETEFWFEEIVFRFASDRFVEASFKTPAELEINDEIVPFDSLLDFMRKRDGDYFEAFGFGVAPRLGLVYDLQHGGSWTTAFAEGRWDEIRENANKQIHRNLR